METNNNQNPTNTDIVPYKAEVFESYCLWKSLPAFFKYPPKDKKTGMSPSPKEYAEMMGIEDPQILELVEIKTQREFAERFDIHPDTLSDWNKQVAVRDSMQEIRKWAKSLSKNVIMGLYNATIRGGLPQHYLAWFKIVEQWIEKPDIEPNYQGVAIINIIRNDGNKHQLGTNGEADRSVGHIAG